MNVQRLLFVPWGAAMVMALSAAPAYGQATTSVPASQIAEPAHAESAWGWLKMPKITMPKVEMPKMPADPLAPFKTSAQKVKDGSKRAWEGTKELFTFGRPANEQPAARVAQNGEAPSMLQRMFGAKEKEPEGPQTITEWMSQKRLDP